MLPMLPDLTSLVTLCHVIGFSWSVEGNLYQVRCVHSACVHPSTGHSITCWTLPATQQAGTVLWPDTQAGQSESPALICGFVLQSFHFVHHLVLSL